MNTLRLFKLHYNSIPKAFLFFFFKQSFSDYTSAAQAENLSERKKKNAFTCFVITILTHLLNGPKAFLLLHLLSPPDSCVLLHMKAIEHTLLSQTTNGIKRHLGSIAILGRGLDYGEL